MTVTNCADSASMAGPSLHRVVLLIAVLTLGCGEEKTSSGVVDVATECQTTAVQTCPMGQTEGQVTDCGEGECPPMGGAPTTESAPTTAPVMPPECTSNDDCESGVCSEGDCQAPRCDDQIQNGSETDIDCGGSCDGCAVGEQCVESTDCADGVCTDEVCNEEASAYPAGPYGAVVGDTVANLVLGTADDLEESFSMIRDGGGSLLLIFSTAAWCARCAADMPELVSLFERYAPLGLDVRVSLFENSASGTPQSRDAELYGSRHTLPFPVLVDAMGQLHQYFPRVALPMVMIVDQPTMTLLYADLGWDYLALKTMVSDFLGESVDLAIPAP